MIGSWKQQGQGSRWAWFIGISLIIHGGMIAGIVGLNWMTFRGGKSLPAISVQLVAPSVKEKRSHPKSERKRVTRRPTRRRSIPKPVLRAERRVVSIAQRPIEIPQRQIVTPSKPQRGKREAPKKKEVQVVKERPTASREQGVVSSVAITGRSEVLTYLERRYISILQERIFENWRAYVPDNMGLLGEVIIVVGKEGRVKGFKLVKGSGMGHVDESLIRAIKKLTLPPPPPRFIDQPLRIRFWSHKEEG